VKQSEKAEKLLSIKKKKGTTENNETEINNLSDTEFKI